MGKKNKKKNKQGPKERPPRIRWDIYWDCCSTMDCDLDYKKAKAVLHDLHFLCQCKEKKIFIERIVI